MFSNKVVTWRIYKNAKYYLVNLGNKRIKFNVCFLNTLLQFLCRYSFSNMLINSSNSFLLLFFRWTWALLYCLCQRSLIGTALLLVWFSPLSSGGIFSLRFSSNLKGMAWWKRLRLCFMRIRIWGPILYHVMFNSGSFFS